MNNANTRLDSSFGAYLTTVNSRKILAIIANINIGGTRISPAYDGALVMYGSGTIKIAQFNV